MKINVADFFVEEKRVKMIKATEEKTPLGDAIFEVTFEEGEMLLMTRAKFEAMRTKQKSTATDARNALCTELGRKIYALMCEYGLKFSEVDPVLNETVRLTNDNQNHAMDILWGNEAYDRSLLDVNRVLLTKYDSKTSKEVSSPDESAPVGGVTDTKDKK